MDHKLGLRLMVDAWVEVGRNQVHVHLVPHQLLEILSFMHVLTSFTLEGCERNDLIMSIAMK